MGVYIKREADQKLFNDAITDANSIIQSSIFEKVSSLKENIESNLLENQTGFCIRYHEVIPFNPNRPLCNSCYKVWVEFSDPDYPENYCHACGERANISYRKPLCERCYNNIKQSKNII